MVREKTRENILVDQATWFCEMCVTSKQLGVKSADAFQKAIEAWFMPVGTFEMHDNVAVSSAEAKT